MRRGVLPVCGIVFVLAPGAAGQCSRPATCPPNWHGTDNGDLCVENQLQEAGGMYDTAIPNCQAKQARVCTHVDMMTACGISGFNPFAGASTGWYGDHGVAADGNWDAPKRRTHQMPLKYR
jgi:hypothetical protein